MRTFVLAMVLVTAPAFSQVPAEKARLAEKKKDVSPRAAPVDTRERAMARGTKAEQRRMETLSKASKERHKDAKNAIRNER